MFAEAFASLPFRRGDELKILDVGCGLGFLSCVTAKFYRKARVTGIDTFEHSSLKGSSLELLSDTKSPLDGDQCTGTSFRI
jgi:2-polyprenyl-3-methyl-5-hydroxy-6-metoxy-1,4-benzoquinol methylase